MRTRRVIGTSAALIGIIIFVKLFVGMERELAEARMQERLDAQAPRLFDDRR